MTYIYLNAYQKLNSLWNDTFLCPFMSVCAPLVADRRQKLCYIRTPPLPVWSRRVFVGSLAECLNTAHHAKSRNGDIHPP